MAELHDLSPAEGSRRSRKRLGRGQGSGTGKTAGKGQKGQNSRSGGGVSAGFEGGQMPLQRRIPKRGFTNINRVEYQVVNVRDLVRHEPGDVTPESLREHGLISSLRLPVKILGTGAPRSCIRYSRIPATIAALPSADLSQWKNTTDRPIFYPFLFKTGGGFEVRPAEFGEPGCALLHLATPQTILAGAEDEGEMAPCMNSWRARRSVPCSKNSRTTYR